MVFYKILSLEPTASIAEITEAYERLNLHYSTNGRTDISNQFILIKLKEAHDVLSNPDKRSEYDKKSENAPTIVSHEWFTQLNVTEIASADLLILLGTNQELIRFFVRHPEFQEKLSTYMHCFASVSSVACMNILRNPKLSSMLSGKDLLDLSSKYDVLVLDWILGTYTLAVAMSNYEESIRTVNPEETETNGFYHLGKYFLSQNKLPQAAASFQAAWMKLHGPSYLEYIAIEGITESDLKTCLLQVLSDIRLKRANDRDCNKKDTKQFILIERMVRAKLLEVTDNDSRYKTAECQQRDAEAKAKEEKDEAEALAIEQDKIAHREAIFIRDICRNLYIAAMGPKPKETILLKIMQLFVAPVKTLDDDSTYKTLQDFNLYVVNRTDDQTARCCMHLAFLIATFVRDNEDPDKNISIDPNTLRELKANEFLKMYLRTGPHKSFYEKIFTQGLIDQPNSRINFHAPKTNIRLSVRSASNDVDNVHRLTRSINNEDL